MGTTGNGILPHLVASTHTTLDALQLQNALHDFSSQGANFVALEASSHGPSRAVWMAARLKLLFIVT